MKERSDVDKGEERVGELVITGGHTAMFLERTEEVLHAMPMPIVAFVEGTWFIAPGGCGQTGEDAQFIQLNAERIGVISLVADHGRTAGRIDLLEQLRSLERVGQVAGTEFQHHRPTISIHDGMDLGSKAATTGSHGLRQLAASRVGAT